MADEPWSFIREFFGASTERAGAVTEIICRGCGIVFSVPKAYADAKEIRKETIHCPNGHTIRLGAP